MRCFFGIVAAAFALSLEAGCGQPASVPAGAVPGGAPVAPAQRRAGKIGLGALLTTRGGGQIYGFDVSRSETDGILAATADTSQPGVYAASMQTFNEDTGAIVRSFARSTGTRNSFAVDGIFQGDAALVTHYIVPKGKIYALRRYQTVAPVSAGKFTGVWTPPLTDIDVQAAAREAGNDTSALFAIELKHQDQPVLIASDVAKNLFSKVVSLDPNLFGGADAPQLGSDAYAGQAVFALSPDGGRVGGAAPINVLVDLTSGGQQQFTGYNNGPFGAGFVNGAAVDPTTAVEATTTELNAQLELYDLRTQTGIAAVQLPCTGPSSQSNSGAGIAVDPVHHLFLVTDPLYCAGNQGSALLVYDETGKLVEAITGFKFAIAEPAPAIVPSKRMGWAFGPAFDQLQQFFY